MHLDSAQLNTISSGAKAILHRLNSAGKAYLVGGAVRDLLLGHPLHDEDIATSLRPEEMIRLFDDTVVLETGIKHGTVTIIWEHQPYEVTTFRSEGPYLDGRRPSYVNFETDINEDLSRRDFTVNAIAVGADGAIIDPFDGLRDLDAKIIRAVREPNERFREDALRLMRAVRFANRLDFAIEPATLRAIKDNARLLAKISDERIADEFLKIVEDDPRGVETLYELGLLDVIFPELAEMFRTEQETPWHKDNVGRHSVNTALYAEDLTFRLAALLHDIGKPPTKTYGDDGVAHFYDHAAVGAEMSKKLLKKLFLPKRQRQIITRTVLLHDYISKKPSKIARMVRNESPETLKLVIQVKRADIAAQSEHKMDQKEALIDEQEALMQRFCAGPHRVGDLVIDGRDLKNIGYEGRQISERLEETLAFVMEDPSRNERERLLDRAERMLPQVKDDPK